MSGARVTEPLFGGTAHRGYHWTGDTSPTKRKAAMKQPHLHVFSATTIAVALALTGCSNTSSDEAEPTPSVTASAETAPVQEEAEVDVAPVPGDVTLSNGLTVPRVLDHWVLIETVTEDDTSQKYITDAYLRYEAAGGSGVDGFDLYEYLDTQLQASYPAGATSQSALYRKTSDGDDTFTSIALVSRIEGLGRPDEEPQLVQQGQDFLWSVTGGGVHWAVAGYAASDTEITSLVAAVEQLSLQG